MSPSPLLPIREVLHSRAHRLGDVHPLQKPELWLKREDELPHGGKQRKYTSLLPALQRENVDCIALLGSSGSNHLVAALQLLRPHWGHRLRVVLRAGHSDALPGNPLLLHLLTEARERVVVPRSEWRNAQEIAAETLERDFPGQKGIVIPEGAFHPWALQGALSLGQDLVRNEQEIGYAFRRVYVDAGTGLTAAGLWLSAALLGRDWEIVVTSRAEAPEALAKRLQEVRQWMAAWDGGIILPQQLPEVLAPDSGKSFGSVTAEHLEMVKKAAVRGGILLDPLYGAPLMISSIQHLEANLIPAPSVVIHGGGVHALHGYNDRLRK